ncbi:MAG: LysR family transcriptional regulator [Bradymonadia bacterium]
MTTRQLSQIDVNLLITLDVLLETQSVTGAARRLGLTQPAVSQALGRLRSMLDDPILVRRGSRMAPTPRAQSLAGPLRRILSDLQALIADQPRFDPATSTAAFTMFINDYVGLVVLPPLMATLRQIAPGIDLRCRPVAFDTLTSELDRGDVDLALGVLPPHPDSIQSAPVIDESFVCLLRPDHPALPHFDLATYADLGHLLVSPRGQRRGGVVDDRLAEQGLSRRVVVEVPYFLAAPFVLAQTDLVTTLPSRVAGALSAPHGLVQRPPPLPLNGFSINMYWHMRYDREPALTWLRGVITEVCAEL